MSKEITWEPKKVKVSALKENPTNPKVLNEKGKSRLQKTLSKYGLAGTLVCNSDLSIIDGHSRKKELLASGIKDVWVSVPSRKLTKKEYEEFNAVFDLAKAGDSDMMLIEETFGDEFMEEWDLESIKKPEVVEDNFEGQAPKMPITKAGDIYEMNQHRFQCGDSCNAEIVSKTLDTAKPILMVTDPPYGVDYDADWRNRADRANGKPDGARAIGLVNNDDVIDWAEAYRLFKGNVVYLWHAGRHAREVATNIESAGFIIVNQIIWAKNGMVISRGDYHWQHEPCWYAVRKGQKHNFTGNRSQTTLWQIDRPKKSETGHSTQKPVECMARPIRNNTYERESVYDPFLGSGTTIIAADQLNRSCYGQEIDPSYCDVIVARYAKFRLNASAALVIKKNGRSLSDKEIQEYLDKTNVEKVK